MNYTIVGNHDENTIEQLKTCAASAHKAVLCADGHLGYSMPVGGVCAYKDMISVSGVGFDIACGNMAVKTDMNISDVNLERVGQEIARSISFGMGRTNATRVESPVLEKDYHPAWYIPFIGELRDMASHQLGTVGSGNHYVDLFKDKTGTVWVGVHFGSRGLGHKIATYYLKAAGGKDGMNVAPALLSVKSDLGHQYVNAMKLAGDYAYAGREWVVREVLSILGARAVDTIHNHHNYAWHEEHDGEMLWVVRKGSTPAFPEQRGFVGSNMGSDSVIIKGVDSQRSRDLLYSTVHGAGRVMSRSEAAGKTKWIDGKKVRVGEGKVNETVMRKAVHDKGILLFGGGADEAPEVYKDLTNVLTHHNETIEVLEVLTPLVVVMAGADEKDPYKD